MQLNILPDRNIRDASRMPLRNISDSANLIAP